jgi:hypothetical protein
MPAPPASEMHDEVRNQAADAGRGDSVAKRQSSPLGTGHGRDETSYATRVAFERASTTPSETLAVRYDRRETLAALGVIPREPYYARRSPEPFPGALRFVPDPR